MVWITPGSSDHGRAGMWVGGNRSPAVLHESPLATVSICQVPAPEGSASLSRWFTYTWLYQLEVAKAQGSVPGYLPVRLYNHVTHFCILCDWPYIRSRATYRVISHQVIIITGLNKLYDCTYVLALKMALNADRA